MNIEMGKPYQTRDGRPARVLCVDAKSIQPVSALVTQRDGLETMCDYNADGSFCFGPQDSPNDLVPAVPAPAKFSRKQYVNVYPGNSSDIILHQTKKDADRSASKGRIACVEVTISGCEGDGL